MVYFTHIGFEYCNRSAISLIPKSLCNFYKWLALVQIKLNEDFSSTVGQLFPFFKDFFFR